MGVEFTLGPGFFSFYVPPRDHDIRRLPSAMPAISIRTFRFREAGSMTRTREPKLRIHGRRASGSRTERVRSNEPSGRSFLS